MLRPLQTRAVLLEVPPRRHQQSGVHRINSLADRAYNTIALPILRGGELLPQRRRGIFTMDRTAMPALLETIRQRHLSLWAYLDPLSAGLPGARKQGALARSHHDWLMRGINGLTHPIEGVPTPGLFCWQTEEWRRMLGDVCAWASDQLPLNALVLDLRSLPVPSLDPRRWTALSPACLEQMREELQLSSDEFLGDVTEELYFSIESWRIGKLREFLASLHARTRCSRSDLPMFAVVRRMLRPDRTPYLPWRPWFADGLFDLAILEDEPSAFADHLQRLDSAAEFPIPALAGAESEADLLENFDLWRHQPHLGWFVFEAPMQSGPLSSMVPVTWREEGAVESHPIDAARTMIHYLADVGQGNERAKQFLDQLSSYFDKITKEVDPKHLLSVQHSLVGMLKGIRDDSGLHADDRQRLVLGIERLIRMLQLVPIPPVLY